MKSDLSAHAVQNNLKSTAALFLIVSGISFSSICFANAESCKGFQKPSLTYTAHVEAISRNDWKSAYSYVTPSVRRFLYRDFVFGLIVASSFDDDLDQGIRPILSQNGFTIDSNGQYVTLEDDLDDVDSWPKLMEELTVYLHKNQGYTFALEENILTNIDIQDLKATGTLPTRNGRASKSVSFTKMESGWCLGAQGHLTTEFRAQATNHGSKNFAILSAD